MTVAPSNSRLAPVADAQPAAAAQGSVKRLLYIDALRGLAALGVFLTHIHAIWLHSARPHGWNATTLVTRIAGYGVTGVDLFIVLSGFCLFYPLTRNAHKPNLGFDARTFYRRRALRILPAYYLALLLATALILSPKLQPYIVAHPIHVTDFLAYAFLVQTFSSLTIGTINGSFWTIALEAQLYIVFPLLLAIHRRQGLRGVAIAGLAACAAWDLFTRWCLWHGYFPLAAVNFDRHFPAHWPEFIAGMVAASLVTRPRENQEKWALLLMICLAPLCLATLPLHITGIVHSVAWGTVYASLILVLAHAVQRFPQDKFSVLSLLAGLGTISYSFYLLHQPVVELTAPLVAPLHLPVLAAFGVSLLVVAPVMVVLALFFYLTVERPFLQSSKSFVLRKL